VKTALLVIATGERYRPYVNPLLESAKKHFVEHDAIVWTDGLHSFDAKFMITKAAEGFPGETLHRYHTFLEQSWFLQKYDQLFYIDVDMRFVAPVGEEVFSNGITATLHPGYVGTVGTPERNPDSLAMIPFNAKNKYYCGGFNGGHATSFLMMAEAIKERIDIDSKRGVVAVWHDESHLNRYLYERVGLAKTLDPSYCYPENAGSHYLDKWRAAGINPTPKILALTK
jgi:histo-blood group ABO system transferase